MSEAELEPNPVSVTALEQPNEVSTKIKFAEEPVYVKNAVISLCLC